MLEIDSEEICFVIFKARQYQAKVTPALPEEASDFPDDHLQVLKDEPVEDAVYEELLTTLRTMNETEIADVVTLVRLGQEEISVAEWDEAVEESRQLIEPTTPRQLLAIPLLASYLEDAYNQLGHSCAEWEADHL